MLSFVFAVTSCKKEEEIIEGCTDNSAMNYSPHANSNDGSCIFAYDIAQGEWNITPDCDDLPIPIPGISLNDMLPETITVQGQGDNILYIDIDGEQVTGEINQDGVVVVAPQTIQVDMGLGPTDVNVEGNGIIESINSGSMSLNYSFDIPFVGSQSISCDIALNR